MPNKKEFASTADLCMAIQKAKIGTMPLDESHRKHLESQGFSKELIDQLVKKGKRVSISEPMAKKLRFLVKDYRYPEPVSSGGCLYIMGDRFAQLRLDKVLYSSAANERRGKRIKYATPAGLPTQAEYPEGEGPIKVITEGSNDRLAFEHFCKVATAALTGVNNFKCLDPDNDGTQGAAIIYDADSRTNKNVFAAMLEAAEFVGGLVGFLPRMEKYPTGGAVEFVKHCKENGLDPVVAFQRDVLDQAMTPAQALRAWPATWDGITDQEQLEGLAETAIKLSVKHLPVVAQDNLAVEVAKASKVSKTSLNRLLRSYQKEAAQAQEKEDAKKRREEAMAGKKRTWTDYVEFAGTVESTVRNHFFGERGEQWAMINGDFHRWDGIYWQRISSESLGQQLTDFLACVHTAGKGVPQFIYESDKNLNSARNYNEAALSIGDVLRRLESERRGKLCFKNGVLDVISGNFVEQHDRYLYLTRCMPHEYIPDAPMPEHFKKFVATSYGEDLVELIRAILGMLLDPSHPYGKFVYIQGASGSGKGVLIHIMEQIIGTEYTASINSLDELCDMDKRHQMLAGRHLCKLPDVAGKLGKIDAFLSLVQNETMSGRALRSSETYNIKWDCRFVMASVKPLQNFDAADGWARRVIHIVSGRRKGFKKDLNLLAKLEAEIPQIIAWALAMDRQERIDWLDNASDRLATTGHAMRESEIAGSSLKAFVEECATTWTGLESYTIHELHKFYEMYCRDAGLAPKGRTTFKNELLSSFPQLFQPRRRAKAGEQGDRSGFIPACWHISLIPGLFGQGFESGGSTSFNPEKLSEGGLDAVRNVAEVEPVEVETAGTEPPEAVTTQPPVIAMTQQQQIESAEDSGQFPISEALTKRKTAEVEGGYQEPGTASQWLPGELAANANESQIVAYIEAFGRAFVLATIAGMTNPDKSKAEAVYKNLEPKAGRRCGAWQPTTIQSWASAISKAGSKDAVDKLVASLDKSQKRVLWCCLSPSEQGRIRQLS